MKALRVSLAIISLVVISLPLLLAVPLVSARSTQASVSPVPPFQVGSRPDSVVAQSSSLNWAGYYVSGPSGSVTDVKGSWIVPSLICSSSTTYAAFWVGIDGASDSTVEQTGVLAECYHGSASYSTWYEFYPSSLVYVTTNVPVKAGDKVSAEVSVSASQSFTVTITDTTTGATYTNTQTDASAQQTSAEWIVERPALCGPGPHCSLSTLADYGTAQFGAYYTGALGDSATVSGTTGPISSFSTGQSITMVSNNGGALAQPSSLNGDGGSFAVSYMGTSTTTTSSTISSTISSSTSTHGHGNGNGNGNGNGHP